MGLPLEGADVIANDGHCTICAASTRFAARQGWLRDHYKCEKCGSIPRQRALVLVLESVRPNWRNAEMHESSPSLEFFARQCGRYTTSFFLEGVPPGTTADGKRCENLECLTFADDAFDIFVTQDVLEHVFEPAAALREIMRVLRHGGIHVFTTPKHRSVLRSYRRAQLVDGAVQHVLEPEYHGSPIGDGRALVTWDYGADFEELVAAWGGYLTSTYVIRDRRLGLDGEYLEVFVTVKDSVNRLARPAKWGSGLSTEGD